MRFVEKAINGLATGGGVLGAIVMSIVMIIVVAGVIARAFNHVLAGTYDLVEPLMIVTCAFSFLYCEKKDRHAKADVVIVHLSHRVRAWFEAFTTFLSIIVWAAILWAGWILLLVKWEKTEQTEILKIPITPFRALWLLSVVFMIVFLVIKFLHKIKAGGSK